MAVGPKVAACRRIFIVPWVSFRTNEFTKGLGGGGKLGLGESLHFYDEGCNCCVSFIMDV